MPRFSTFDVWFRPKYFESERLYERLGASFIKRYVLTGCDLVMRRLRRNQGVWQRFATKWAIWY